MIKTILVAPTKNVSCVISKGMNNMNKLELLDISAPEFIPSKKLKGLDSLLSTVQMPSGIPVGTVAIGKAGAINSALLATAILATRYRKIKQKLKLYRKNFEKKVPKRPY